MDREKEIKKMSRKDLLEILLMQSKRIDELEEKLKETNELLESKKISISKVGSIAEAALVLNKVFEKVEESAKQYLDNIKMLEEELKNKMKENE